jgi:hypothetical protein
MMPTNAEFTYWYDIWPEALLFTLKKFMASGDIEGLSGICSLATCHRQSTDYEAAVCSLIRGIFSGIDEAKKLREKLTQREAELKRLGIYEVEKRRAELLESGLIPVSKLETIVTGFRRAANEIYSKLRDMDLLRIESHTLKAGGSPMRWIGLNAKWDAVIEDIQTKGSSDVFSSSLAIMLCMALDRRGITTVLPMARSIIAAENRGGEITVEELKAIYRNVKALNVILERQREKDDKLKIFSDDFGKKLRVSRSVAYAVGVWQAEANRLARARGLV